MFILVLRQYHVCKSAEREIEMNFPLNSSDCKVNLIMLLMHVYWKADVGVSSQYLGKIISHETRS